MKIETSWDSLNDVGTVSLYTKDGDVIRFFIHDAKSLEDIGNIGNLCYKFGLEEGAPR